VTLLDIWMPGMDGMEVLKRLKWISPDSQVIMISGHATISTAMTAVKLGALDFIEKPLSLDILLITVRRALDRQKELQNGMGSEEPVFQEPPRTAPAPSPVQEAVLQSNESSKGKGRPSSPREPSNEAWWFTERDFIPG